MVKSLLILLRLLVSNPVLEVVGAGLIVAGVYVAAGTAGALIAAGIAVLLKTLARDLDPEGSS